jgi:hypothetical protein
MVDSRAMATTYKYRTVHVMFQEGDSRLPDMARVIAELRSGERIVSVYPVAVAPKGAYVGDLYPVYLCTLVESAYVEPTSAGPG